VLEIRSSHLQEPELFQQLCKSMGRYEDLAGLNIRKSLRGTNDEGKLRGGTGRRVNALAMSECVHCLEQAADLYGQVSAAESGLGSCPFGSICWSSV